MSELRPSIQIRKNNFELCAYFLIAVVLESNIYVYRGYSMMFHSRYSAAIVYNVTCGSYIFTIIHLHGTHILITTQLLFTFKKYIYIAGRTVISVLSCCYQLIL